MISVTWRGWYFSDDCDSTFNRDAGRMAMKTSRGGGLTPGDGCSSLPKAPGRAAAHGGHTT